jgi:hypothetical protein
VLDEFYRLAFRKKIYGSIPDLQVDLDRFEIRVGNARSVLPLRSEGVCGGGISVCPSVLGAWPSIGVWVF